MPGGGADGVVLWLKGLHDDRAAQRAAPGAPGDLGQDLEGALSGTVIGQVEGRLRQDHTHQGDQGQIQAFS